MRVRWRLAGNNVSSFFDAKSIWDLDNLQVQLAYWVQTYASIYELPEKSRPAEDVINDDRALDEWLSAPPESQDKEDDLYSHKPRKSFG